MDPEPTAEGLGVDTTVKRKRTGTDRELVKRHKPDQVPNGVAGRLPRCRSLPVELWQHIFAYLPPAALGRLLQVNRSFNHYLTRVTSEAGSRTTDGRLRIVTSESIWSGARKIYHPTLPKPLATCSELEMWRLILGRRCQFCRKRGSPISATGKVWESGPGSDAVRAVWPFAVRSCGQCLAHHSLKESDLLFSSTSALLPALPFAFLTQNQHYIPSILVQGDGVPPSLQLSKRYYPPHVEDIRRKLDIVQGFGPATAEEWYKGIESMGRKRIDDASRWERWESAEGQGMLVQPSEKTKERVSPVDSRRLPAAQAVANPPSFSPYASPEVHQPLPQRPEIPGQMIMPQPFPQHSYPSVRVERNLRDVNEAKAARRAEIERRCQFLQPPIPARILRHMESFQAAIQISQPLNDAAWDVLKPRLLAQREAAEKAEQDHNAHMTAIQAKLVERRHHDSGLKDSKENQDREWEESRRSIRDRLESYADQFIHSKWADGKAVGKNQCAKFAAEVLVHVREQFSGDASPERTGPQDPEQGAPSNGAAQESSEKLVLEDMKYVFDQKVKPFTDHLRKELFLCASCESNHKYYGFEGIIQHYGAKHTNAFSVGNIVVHWQSAEWPLEPPFHPHPESAKSGYHSSTASRTMSAQGHQMPPFSPFSLGGFTRGTTTTPQIPMGPYPVPQTSPTMYNPAIYPANAPPSYAPPSVSTGNYPYPAQGPPIAFGSAPMTGFQAPHPYQPSFDGHAQDMSGYQGYMPPPHGSTHTGQGLAAASWNPGAWAHQSAGTEPDRAGAASGLVSKQVGYDATSSSEPVRQAGNVPETQPSWKRPSRQLADIALSVWVETSDIRGLPDTVRVCVVVHHVISRFKDKFGTEPTLDMFIDFLETDPLLKPMGNSAHSWADKSGNVSGANAKSSSLDWKRDLFELPDEGWFSTLARDLGDDSEKLQLISEAFPSFSKQSSSGFKFDERAKSNSVDGDGAGNGAETMIRTASGGAASTGERSPKRATSASPREQRLQSLPAVGEDEYDPRRPALELHPVHQLRRHRRQPTYEFSDQYGDQVHYYEADDRILRTAHPERALRYVVHDAHRSGPRSPRLLTTNHNPGGYISLGQRDPYDTNPRIELERSQAIDSGHRRGLASLSDSSRVVLHDHTAIPRDYEMGVVRGGYLYTERQQRDVPLGRSDDSAERFLRDVGPPAGRLEIPVTGQHPLGEQQVVWDQASVPREIDGRAGGQARYASMLHTPNDAATAQSSAQVTPGPMGDMKDRLPSTPAVNTPDNAELDRNRGQAFGHSTRRSIGKQLSSKYARYASFCEDENRPGRVSRQQSRYERYEAQRRQLDRERSTSPVQQREDPPDTPYRPRSPSTEPYRYENYNTRYVYEIPHDPAAADDPDRYSPPPPLPPPPPSMRQYRYADVSHLQKGYDEPVLVRIPDAHTEPRFVRREVGGLVEYASYEREPRGPVYEERGPSYVLYEAPRQESLRHHAPQASPRALEVPRDVRYAG